VLARPGGSSGGKPGKLRKAPSLKGDPDAPDAPGRPGDPDLQATLDDALASASSGWIDVVLAAGRHAPFTFEPTGRQNLRIVGLDGEPAVVDVSEAPIRIRGVGRRQSVELSGFALSSDDSRRPAIVIENCEGLVLLDGLEVRGRRSSGVRLVNAAAVVLQDVKLPELAGLELERGSNAWCRRGQLQELRLSEGSRVESWGTQARSVVDATSEWRRHPAMAAQLGLEQVEGDLVVTVAGAPESAWLGLVSLHLARELAPGAQPMLLYRPMPLGPARALGPDGRDQLVLPVPPSIALLGGPAYLQALLSTEGGQALTPVRSWRPGQGD
jgi:hypothetical protein